MKKSRKIISLTLVFLMIFSMFNTVFAEEITSAVMRIVSIEGTVTVTNQSGKNITARENMKLQNGYTIETAASSYVHISLDDNKAIKLDGLTKCTVNKKGNNLELLLDTGKILYDVSAPLDSSETMNIRTSTMVTGIRGTIGLVTSNSNNESSNEVYEGETLDTSKDNSGTTKTVVTKAGTKTTATKDNQAGSVEQKQEPIDESNQPGFVSKHFSEDSESADRVKSNSDVDVDEIIGQKDANIERDENNQNNAQKDAESEVEDAEVDNTFDTNTGSSGGSSGPSTTTLTAPFEGADITDAFDTYDVVTLSASENIEAVELGAFDVPAGKTLNISSGFTLNLTGSLNVAGTVNVNEGAALNLVGLNIEGTVNVNEGATISSTANIEVNSTNSLNVSGTVTLIGNVDLIVGNDKAGRMTVYPTGSVTGGQVIVQHASSNLIINRDSFASDISLNGDTTVTIGLGVTYNRNINIENNTNPANINNMGIITGNIIGANGSNIKFTNVNSTSGNNGSDGTNYIEPVINVIYTWNDGWKNYNINTIGELTALATDGISQGEEYTIRENMTIDSNLTLVNNGTLNIAEGKTLTVADNITFTVDANSSTGSMNGGTIVLNQSAGLVNSASGTHNISSNILVNGTGVSLSTVAGKLSGVITGNAVGNAVKISEYATRANISNVDNQLIWGYEIYPSASDFTWNGEMWIDPNDTSISNQEEFDSKFDNADNTWTIESGKNFGFLANTDYILKSGNIIVNNGTLTLWENTELLLDSSSELINNGTLTTDSTSKVILEPVAIFRQNGTENSTTFDIEIRGTTYQPSIILNLDKLNVNIVESAETNEAFMFESDANPAVASITKTVFGQSGFTVNEGQVYFAVGTGVIGEYHEITAENIPTDSSIFDYLANNKNVILDINVDANFGVAADGVQINYDITKTINVGDGVTLTNDANVSVYTNNKLIINVESGGTLVNTKGLNGEISTAIPSAVPGEIAINVLDGGTLKNGEENSAEAPTISYSTIEVDGTFTNNGELTYGNAVNIAEGGTFTNKGDIVYSANSDWNTINNEGTFINYNNGTNYRDYSENGYALTGSGTMMIAPEIKDNSGSAPIYDIIAHGNPITISDTSITYEFNGGSFTLIMPKNIDDNTIYDPNIIYGGSDLIEVASTSVTMTGGSATAIYGGGYFKNVTGDVFIDVSGGTLSGQDFSNAQAAVKTGIIGGGIGANVGNVMINVSDNASVESLLGGGVGVVNQTSAGNIDINIEGGTFANITGGGANAGANSNVGDVTVDITAGTIRGDLVIGTAFGAGTFGNYTLTLGVGAELPGYAISGDTTFSNIDLHEDSAINASGRIEINISTATRGARNFGGFSTNIFKRDANNTVNIYGDGDVAIGNFTYSAGTYTVNNLGELVENPTQP